MKLLISESGRKVEWNGNVKSLNTGVYYLMKRIETIRVLGSEYSRNASLSESPDSNVNSEDETVDETSGTITKPVNNDRVAGKIHYWKGERYCRNHEGKLERFPASDEPQKVNGDLFSGSYSAGVFKWDRSKPEFAAVGNTEKPIEYSATKDLKIESKTKSSDKTTEESIAEMERMVDNIDSKSKKKLKAIAELPEEDTPFDDAAFLEDIADPVNEPEIKLKDSCALGADGLTLIVCFEGVKYQKRFKSEKVATSQLEVFKSLLLEDKTMAKELLNGSMSTFTKIV